MQLRKNKKPQQKKEEKKNLEQMAEVRHTRTSKEELTDPTHENPAKQ